MDSHWFSTAMHFMVSPGGKNQFEQINGDEFLKQWCR